MSIKSLAGKVFASVVVKKMKKWQQRAVECQEKIMLENLNRAKATKFGLDHGFERIKSYADFKQQVPVREYEELKPYIEEVLAGKSDILWPGKPLYLCKTSGTTSGTKYIPLTRESMPNHINSARNALLCYIHNSGQSKWLNGKMIFLQGSPELKNNNGIPVGRLSGIVAHHVPSYLQKNRLPSFETNTIDDWEIKVERIVEETIDQNMTLISGIPSWVQYYFEKLKEHSGGKPVKDIFPNLQLFVYGGVNYEPYRSRFEELIGRKVDSIETYPASEGFIAFQDTQDQPGLLLAVNDGIFYEFIPADEYFSKNPQRLSLGEVELDKNYALVMSTNAGLWAYSIGDTIKFVSKDPYRIIVTGRIKHFISAFGEHVIAEEVEYAMNIAAAEFGAGIIEFTVAPQITPSEGLPYHEWFVAFANKPTDMEAFTRRIDQLMQEKNIYYADLLDGKILQPLKISEVGADAFNNYMKSIGKLGGQNKIPRLGNDRKIADFLVEHRL